MNFAYSRLAVGMAMICMAFTLPAAETSQSATPAPATNHSSSFFGDRLAAQGKGVSVTQNEVEEAYIGYKATSAGQGRAVPDSMRPAIERQIVERLVHRQLLMQIANEEDKAKAKEASSNTLAAFKSRMTSEASFNRQLRAMGMTLEYFTNKMYEENLSSQVADRVLRPSVEVTTDQVQKLYETNTVAFTQPAKLRISHILFLTQDALQTELTEAQKKAKFQTAEKVLARLKGGEDFAKLAREFSEDPNSRENGGELPPLALEQMAPELGRAVSSLAIGDLGDIVTTRVGYHIVKLREKIPSQTTPLTEAQKEIREFLTRQEIQKKLPDYLKKLREDAGVKFMDL